MKHKKKLSLLLALILGTTPVLTNVNQLKSYAKIEQEDWDGSVPPHLQGMIDELFDKLTPEQQAYLKKVGYRNAKLVLKALNFLLGFYYKDPNMKAYITYIIENLEYFID